MGVASVVVAFCISSVGAGGDACVAEAPSDALLLVERRWMRVMATRSSRMTPMRRRVESLEARCRNRAPAPTPVRTAGTSLRSMRKSASRR